MALPGTAPERDAFTLVVNGTPVGLDLPGTVPLLQVLRNDLGLNGPKYGCGLGQCGACTVLVDGVPGRSCILPLSVLRGRHVTTLEGLAADGVLHTVQRAFVEEQAAQCGYCLNGMIMTTVALLERDPAPDDADDPARARRQPVPLRYSYRDRARREAGRNGDTGYGSILSCDPRRSAIDGRRRRRCPVALRSAGVSEAGGSAASDWRKNLRRHGMLLVLRGDHAAGLLHEEPEAASPEPEGHGLELLLSVDNGGRVTAYNGHVDLGTGIGTALAQIVAEELDVAFDAVTMVLGHSGSTPNQGATIASETIQVTAVPLRRAAAQARHALVALAAEAMGVPAADLTVEDGTVRRVGGNAALTYGDLLRGRRIHLRLDEAAPVKAAADYRLVGRRVPRVDIPAKATGAFTYVHDVRVPGMLHGRVVRPPYAGFDHGPFVGRSLVAVDESSVAHVPGLVAVVVVGDFVGVVAEREEQAARAAEALVTRWRGWDPRRTSARPRPRCAPTRPRRACCSTRATSRRRSPAPRRRCDAPTAGPTSCTAPSGRPAPSPMCGRTASRSGPAPRTR